MKKVITSVLNENTEYLLGGVDLEFLKENYQPKLEVTKEDTSNGIIFKEFRGNKIIDKIAINSEVFDVGSTYNKKISNEINIQDDVNTLFIINDKFTITNGIIKLVKISDTRGSYIDESTIKLTSTYAGNSFAGVFFLYIKNYLEISLNISMQCSLFDETYSILEYLNLSFETPTIAIGTFSDINASFDQILVKSLNSRTVVLDNKETLLAICLNLPFSESFIFNTVSIDKSYGTRKESELLKIVNDNTVLNLPTLKEVTDINDIEDHENSVYLITNENESTGSYTVTGWELLKNSKNSYKMTLDIPIQINTVNYELFSFSIKSDEPIYVRYQSSTENLLLYITDLTVITLLTKVNDIIVITPNIQDINLENVEIVLTLELAQSKQVYTKTLTGLYKYGLYIELDSLKVIESLDLIQYPKGNYLLVSKNIVNYERSAIAKNGTYSIDFTNGWEEIESPFDGYRKFRSCKSWHVDNGSEYMTIKLNGVLKFPIKIRNHAEGSSYDYTIIGKLDDSTNNYNNQLYKDTRGYSSTEGDILSNYQTYTITLSDGLTVDEHFFNIYYKKDGSINNGDDRGYILLPEELEPTVIDSVTPIYKYKLEGIYSNSIYIPIVSEEYLTIDDLEEVNKVTAAALHDLRNNLLKILKLVEENEKVISIALYDLYDKTRNVESDQLEL